MQNKLAIISVVYKNYKVLDDFIASFEKQKNTHFQLFLVDHTPKPQEREYPPFVHVIQSYNRGYGAGVNTGVKKAIERGFSNFCVMNNDTYFEDGLIDAASNAIEAHPKTIIGGKIYYAKGYEYHKEKYKKTEVGKVLWYAGGEVDWDHGLVKHHGVDEVDHGRYNKQQKTDFVTGCLMCFDNEVIESVGFWDEEYFLYYEDADYCERAKQKNISLLYDPSLVIWHKNAQSTKGVGSSLHKKYQEKNRLKFGVKYAPPRTKLHLLKNYMLSFSKA